MTIVVIRHSLGLDAVIRPDSVQTMQLVRPSAIFLTIYWELYHADALVQSLPSQTMIHTGDPLKVTLLCPSALLKRVRKAAVDQALSQPARIEELIQVCHGVYVRPISTWFGLLPPIVEKVLVSVSTLWGETFEPSSRRAANDLGLTTQVPIRSVYLTYIPGRKLKLGGLAVELRHAPRWQLTAPHRLAADAVRTLAWKGLNEVEVGLDAIRSILPSEDLRELDRSPATMLSWMAKSANAMVAYA